MGERKVVQTWYRSVKNGKTWCESADPEEVAESGGDTFFRMQVWQEYGDWEPWDATM